MTSALPLIETPSPQPEGAWPWRKPMLTFLAYSDAMQVVPLFIAMLFFVLQLCFGLSQKSWSLAALPIWYFGVALLCGLLGVVGARLSSRAAPTMSYWQRTCLIGAGWGLPFSCLMLGKDALTKEGILWISPIVLLVMSLGYGAVMATTQTRKGKG